MFIDNLGYILKKERQSWGMSRGRLARLSNTDKETIEDIESGKIKNPDFFLILNICDILDLVIFDYIKNG